MNLEIKILIFWLVLLLLFKMGVWTHYRLSDPNLQFRYFIQETFFGIIYLILKWLGIICIPGYILIRVFMWWFDTPLN